jgi:hypothetical protein
MLNKAFNELGENKKYSSNSHRISSIFIQQNKFYFKPITHNNILSVMKSLTTIVQVMMESD